MTVDLHLCVYRTEMDDEDPSAFEAELAMLDEVEAEMKLDKEDIEGCILLYQFD